MNVKNSTPMTIFELLQKKEAFEVSDNKDNLTFSKQGVTFLNEDDFFRNSSIDYFRQSMSSACSVESEASNNIKGKTMTNKNKYTKNDFERIALLGRGAYGNVYKAKHKETGDFYSIKVVDKKMIERENKRYQIFVENELLNYINYPGVIKVFGYYEDANEFSLVEEYCSKGDLNDFIEKHENIKFTIDEIQFILGQIILCVEHLNSLNIIHRDIKPDNFIIDKYFRLKLIDFATATFKGKILDEETNSFIEEDKFLGRDSFNLARSINSNMFGIPNYAVPEESVPLSNPLLLAKENKPNNKESEILAEKLEVIKRQNFVGTAEYMPPEIINNQHVGDFTDIWSVMCIAFKLFTGESPFKDKTEYLIFQNILHMKFKEKLKDKIPEDAADLIFSILKINPFERFGYDKNRNIYNFNIIKRHPFFVVRKDYDIKKVVTELLRKVNIILQFGTLNPDKSNDNLGAEDIPINPNKTVNRKESINQPNHPQLENSVGDGFVSLSMSDSSMLSISRDTTGARVLKSGTLKKRSPYFYYDKRKIILFDTPRIDYYKPDTKEFRGSISLDKSCRAELVGGNQFYLHTPNRTFSFMCKEKYDISPWVNAINKAIQDYGIN